MTSSIYLSRDEEVLLDRLAGMNQLSRNNILRLGLRQLASLADPTGRLPLVGHRAAAGETSTTSTRDASPPARADT